MLLSSAADKLAQAWQDSADGGGAGLDATVCFWRALRLATQTRFGGPRSNGHPVSRAALVAADHVVVNVEFGAYSLPGIRETGTALRLWRQDWQARRNRASSTTELPEGAMKSVGYVPLPPADSRSPAPWMPTANGSIASPANTVNTWKAIPPFTGRSLPMDSDDRCLGRLRHFRDVEGASRRRAQADLRHEAGGWNTGQLCRRRARLLRRFSAPWRWRSLGAATCSLRGLTRRISLGRTHTWPTTS